MRNKDNLVGFLLLGFCTVIAVIMLRYIIAGTTPTFNTPRPVSIVLIVVFIGLMIFGFSRGSLGRRLRGGQGGQQWPNPGTGQRSLWDRMRGR